MRYGFVTVGCVLVLAACAESGPPPRTLALACDQDKSAAVAIDDATGTAKVTVNGETRKLQEQPSVTGERYSGNRWAVWRDGDQASLEVDYGRMSCTVASAPKAGVLPRV